MVEIRKLIEESYDRPFIPTHAIMKIELEIEVENIWSVPVGEEGREIKKRKI